MGGMDRNEIGMEEGEMVVLMVNVERNEKCLVD